VHTCAGLVVLRRFFHILDPLLVDLLGRIDFASRLRRGNTANACHGEMLLARSEVLIRVKIPLDLNGSDSEKPGTRGLHVLSF
jgi:hypothetical protein